MADTTATDPDTLIHAHLERTLRLARSFARRFPRLIDEMEGAALVGLTEAAANYDPGRGTAFWTHAARRIVGAMKDELREWSPRGFARDFQREKYGPAPGIMHLSAHIMEGGGSDGPDDRPTGLADTIADPAAEPVGWEAEYHDEVAGLARRIVGGPGAEAFRLMYTHADCATMKRAGAAVGLSEGRISQFHAFAETLLRERFPDPQEVFMHGTTTNRLNGTTFLEPVTLHPDPDAPGSDDAIEGSPVDHEPADSLIRRYAAAHPGMGPGELARLIGDETGRKVHSTKVRCVLGTFVPGGGKGRGKSRKVTASAPDAPPPVPVLAPVPETAPATPTGLRAELEAMLRVVEILEALDAPTGRRVVGWLGARFTPGEGD